MLSVSEASKLALAQYGPREMLRSRSAWHGVSWFSIACCYLHGAGYGAGFMPLPTSPLTTYT